MTAGNPSPQWEHLSSLREKRELYSRDPHFREAFWDAELALGPGFLVCLHRIALLVLKPESFAGRRIDRLLGFLQEREFTPIHVEQFSYTRHISRELWRYQWNAATVEKMDLVDRVNQALPTAVLLLRDDELGSRSLPASVRLKGLKGAALPELRGPGSMRAALAAPNRMLTFVHTADEPADVLREAGIIWARPQRRELFRALEGRLAGDATGECRRLLKRLEATAPEADFDPEGAWRRLSNRVAGPEVTMLAEHRVRYERSGALDWWSFLALADRVEADPWDIIAICAAVVEHQDAGYDPLIEFGEEVVNGWRDGRARLCSP